jgi:NADH-quinone oxidoreductase subunit J
MQTFIIAIYCLVFVITVASALVVVLSRNTLYSAIAMILTMCAIAANFLLMKAEFAALVQLLVYAGAIMVLFLFVIMLLNLRQGEPDSLLTAPRRRAGFILALFLVAQTGYIAWYYFSLKSVSDNLVVMSDSFKETPFVDLAASMMTRYLVPFELTSILLLVAVIGALTLGTTESREEK